MPANLTPMYHRAEQEYRRAGSADERLKCLQEMLKLLPKHKGTDHLQADLKRKIKETREEADTESKSGKKSVSHRVPRQGAGQVVILGPPNSGKSRLLASLTKAEPEVADYPYTTREPQPGMMAWEDVSVQLIDTPPISDTMFEPYLVNIARAADAALLTFDGRDDDAPEKVADVCTQLAERKTRLASETGFAEDDLSTVLLKTLLVVTSADEPGVPIRMEFLSELAPEVDALPKQFVECDRPESVEELRTATYDLLGVIRAYTKKPGKPGEYKDPFTIPEGGTVEDLAYRVHNEIGESLKFAKVWGSSAMDGQSVGREHVLQDRDLVELHT